MAKQAANLPAERTAATTPAKPSKNDFRSLIETSGPRLSDVIPAMMRKHLTPERIIRISLAAYSRKEELRKCEPLSILNAIIQAAQLGFEADGPLGHAYLVPYAGQCTMQIGYKGFCDLARRTAGYDLIDSRLVFAKDVLSLEYTPSPDFRHTPHLGPDPGLVTHAYAYAYLKGSDRPIFEIMTAKELTKVRNSSRSANSPAWKTWEGEMQKKIPLKRMLKDQPLSIELADAIAYDNEVNGSAEIAQERRATLPRGTEGLRQQLAPPEPEAEPEFTTEQGVEQPLRSEDDAIDLPEDPDDVGPGPDG